MLFKIIRFCCFMIELYENVKALNLLNASYNILTFKYSMSYERFSVNSILFKYKYIMIQTIYICKTLHLKGIQK